MKKILILICTILCANVLSAQTFIVGGVEYTVNQDGSTVTVTRNTISQPTDLEIPSTVNGYTVTAIGDNAFNDNYDYIGSNINDNKYLKSVQIPNTVTYIGKRAFRYCNKLESISLDGVTVIDEYAFSYCTELESITFGDNLTSIENNAFEYCYDLTSITIPSSVTSIGNNAFYYTDNLTSVTCLAATAPEIGSMCFTTYTSPYGNRKITFTVPFGSDYSSWEGLSSLKNTLQKINYKIEGETEELNTTFEITEENRRAIINDGVLKIMPGGQLINKTDNNVGGVIEVVTSANESKWNFVGAPFNDYDLYAMKLGPGNTDATVVEFDYTKNDWSMNYSYADEDHIIGAGEGFFAWPFYSGGITFSTKRDNSTPSYQNTAKSTTPDFALNNDEVEVQKDVTGTDERGRWMALVNPYPAKLSVNSFVEDEDNTSNIVTQIQGQGVYVLKYDNGGNQVWDYKTSGDLNVGQGFFVNLANNGNQTIKFTKNQISGYNGNKAKSEIESEKEFIRFAMIEGERESEVLFAHNQDAQEGYDIFDANKLFAMSHIAEPYFVVDGISLVKEEVNLLPYYATMNVKSFGNKEVKFSPNYIPEGLSVTLIDGEESIDLLQGQEYATEISAGENANRFKLLIKKSLGLSDAEELEVNISNDNRIVNIATSETDLQIEVYNALGQKVFETKALNFSLNNVSAGAYMIKAFNNKASKTQKIVVK